MAFYNNKVERLQLVDKIVELLTTAPTGSSEPYWKKVNSGTFTNEGYILHSSGKTGGQDIFVRFFGVTANQIKVSVIENYIPNPVGGLSGTITNESSPANMIYHTNSGYGAAYPVEYHLSFDRDKIILVLTGDKGIDGTVSPVLGWFGMPVRLDPDGDKTNGAVSIACSKNAYEITSGGSSYTNYARCRTLVDRQGTKNALGSMISMGTRFNRSKGWGNEIMLPDIYLQDYDGYEGIRSIMDGVHPIYHNVSAPDFKNGDEIIKNSKRYIIMNVFYDGTSGNQTGFYANSFPSAWMAIEQLL